MKHQHVWVLLALFLASCDATVERGFLPKWDAGYRGEIPDLPVVATVDAATIRDEGHIAIQTAIDAVDGSGAVQLPAGEFELRGPISIRSGVVLHGAGSGKTHLKFHALSEDLFEGDVRPAFGAVRFEGTKQKAEYSLRGGFERGSTQLQLDNTQSLAIRQMVLVFSENDPDLMYTDPRWDTPWAKQSIAQIVEIKQVGPQEITLDVPLRLTYRNGSTHAFSSSIPSSKLESKTSLWKIWIQIPTTSLDWKTRKIIG